MKRMMTTLLLIMALCGSALADGAPKLPETMLPVLDVTLKAGYKYPVYSGPGEEYGRAGNGKATVSTNDWVQVFGQESTYYMVQYALSGGKMRIGWISVYDVEDELGIRRMLEWTWGSARTNARTSVTDDPFGKQSEIFALEAGTGVQTLADLGVWTYIETENRRGFVRTEKLTRQEIPYREHPAYGDAMAFLENAGMNVYVTGMNDQYIYFDLADGGRGTWFYPGSSGGFDRYDLRCWHFYDITDGDIALFSDAVLRILHEVERGDAPEERYRFDYQGDTGRRNAEIRVNNGISFFEFKGRQWLDVLLHQLAAHDGDDALNSLRARAASRMLGRLDKTPVDPVEGCAWYDALTLSVQDDLPPVDARMYVDDPLLAQATQALIDYEEERRGVGSIFLDLDESKVCTIVALKVFKMKEKRDTLTLWANMSSCTYALYDGSRYTLASGLWVPSRVEMVKNDSGDWELKALTIAEDGTLYAPSILKFCDNDKTLADSMMQDGYAGTQTCLIGYLEANGYTDVEEMED